MAALTATAVVVGLVFVIRATTAFLGNLDKPAHRAGTSLNQEVKGSGGPTGGKPVDASAFESGACVAYPPTAGNRHLTVFLDAGHGGIDPGAVGTTQAGQTIEEADLTLPVELDEATILRGEGFRVVVSRTVDGSVARLGPGDVADGVLTEQGAHHDVAARAVCANDAHANVLVGIYFDSGAPDNAGSVTGYDAVRPFAAANLRLAGFVQADVLSALNAHGWGIPDGGVAPDTVLGSAVSSQAVAYGHLLLLGPAEAGYFTTPSQMPGALIEPLFITDPFEGSIAASSLGQQVIAAGLATATEQYFAPAPA
jgi:N-acetylmuramoyl-L-alanine amidase